MYALSAVARPIMALTLSKARAFVSDVLPSMSDETVARSVCEVVCRLCRSGRWSLNCVEAGMGETVVSALRMHGQYCDPVAYSGSYAVQARVSSSVILLCFL